MSANATPPSPTQGEVVSQSDIERILAMVGENNPATAAESLPAKGSEPGPDWQQSHEFPQASSFTPSELRKLRMRHEEFVRSLAARLSIYLRLECFLQMSKLETTSFQQYIEGLANPTHLTLLRLEPLRGVCLIDIPTHLGLCIVDRELGGPARCPDEPRDLSQMEARLVSRVVEIIASEWCSAWSDTLDLRPALLRHESSGRYLRIHSPQTVVLVLGIETRLADTVEQIQIALPYLTLGPLIEKLNAEDETDARPAPDVLNGGCSMNSTFQEVDLKITAELPPIELTVRELGDLKAGDVLRLDPNMSSRVSLCVASTPKFTGSLGTCAGSWAVKIDRGVSGV
jgi:flagellar motor switch protein FliM